MCLGHVLFNTVVIYSRISQVLGSHCMRSGIIVLYYVVQYLLRKGKPDSVKKLQSRRGEKKFADRPVVQK